MDFQKDGSIEVISYIHTYIHNTLEREREREREREGRSNENLLLEKGSLVQM